MATLPMLRRSRWVLVVLCVAAMVYYHLALFVPKALEIRAVQGFGNGYSFGADFYPIWLTSREGLFHHRNPYSAEMTQQIQIGLFGRPVSGTASSAGPNYRAFAYPAFADILFWPLAVLPFTVVRIGLALILSALTALSVVLWLRVLRLHASGAMLALMILLTLSSYAVLEGLFAEQPGLLVAFLLAASLAMLVKGRLFFSGNLLALTLIKPQMMVLLAAYLLLWSFDHWRVRRRFVGGFLFMAAMLGVSSLLVWPRWIPAWLQVMFGYRQYSTPPLVWYLLGNWLGPRLAPVVIGALLACAIALAARMRHVSPSSSEFALTVSLLLAITAITLLPGHAVYDHVVLLPGIISIALSWRRFATSSQPFRIVLGVSTLALFWQWIFAPIVVVARLFLSQELFADVLALPIHTAGSIPFGVCALLGLMLWHITHSKVTGGGNTEQPIVSIGPVA